MPILRVGEGVEGVGVFIFFAFLDFLCLSVPFFLKNFQWDIVFCRPEQNNLSVVLWRSLLRCVINVEKTGLTSGWTS